MKRNLLLVAFTMALLAIGSAWASTPKHHMAKMSGQIVSVTSTQLTLSSTVKGKTEQESFVINPQTKKIGTLNPGERAFVRYTTENGQKVATMIHAHKMTSAKAKTK